MKPIPLTFALVLAIPLAERTVNEPIDPDLDIRDDGNRPECVT